MANEIEVATFWNKEHPLSAKADELFEQLVPGSGQCKTLQGELLRASSKIGYDWFNNGWGCNNWSGAVMFLMNEFSKLPNQPDAAVLKDFQAALEFVHEYSHGEPAEHLDYNKRPCKMVTLIHEVVVNAIVANPEPIENEKDMWDYSEQEYRAPEDDDDEEY